MAGENGVTIRGISELDGALAEIFRNFSVGDQTTTVRRTIRKSGGKTLMEEIKKNISSNNLYKLGNKVARAYAMKNTKDAEGNTGVKIYARRSGNYKKGFLIPIYEGGATRSGRGRIKPVRFVETAEITKGQEAAEATAKEFAKQINVTFQKRLLK
jgi:hypothetical protein